MLFQFEGRILLSYKNKDRVNFNYLSRCISIFLIFFLKGGCSGVRGGFQEKSARGFLSSPVLFGNLHGIMNGNMIDKEKTQALGAEKIPRLLLKYAIPSIIAMLSSSLYNMIDSIFIGHGVGAMAISGLAITMPIMNVIAALGTLVSVGAATLMSVKLGQGDKASAEYILGNLVVLNIIIGLTLTVLGNIFLDEILYFFGASEHTIPYAREFMRIILSGTVVTHIYLSLNDMLRASGYPGRAMTAILLALRSTRYSIRC